MAIIDIPSLSVAAVVADADLLAVTQGTTVPKKQTFTALWNWLIGKGLPTRVTKTTSQTKVSDTTLAADTVLKVPIVANTKYYISGAVFWDTGAAEDFKFDFNGPAAPTLVRVMRWGVLPGGAAVANVAVDTAYNVLAFMNGASGNGGGILFYAIIHNGVNAGDLEFRWAQNVSGVTSTTVLAGSFIDYRAF